MQTAANHPTVPRGASARGARALALCLAVVLTLAAGATGCSLALDFAQLEACRPGEVLVDEDCVCPAGSSFDGQQCVCDASGEAVAEVGECRCPEGTYLLDGACACPEGAELHDGQCVCPPGLAFAPLDGVQACGTCPVELTGSSGGFQVPGESGWCSGLLVQHAPIGDAGRTLLELAAYESEPGVLLLTLGEVDVSLELQLTTYAITLAGDAQVEVSLVSRAQVPLEADAYPFAMQLVRVDGNVFAVLALANGVLLAFDTASGASVSVALAPGSPLELGFHTLVVMAAMRHPTRDGLLAAGYRFDATSIWPVVAYLSLEFDSGTGLTLSPSLSGVPSSDFPSFWAIEPVKDTSGIFVLLGGTARVENPCAPDADCAVWSELRPLLAEITYSSTGDIIVRAAEVDADAFAAGRDAAVASASTELGVTADPTKIGFWSVASAAAGRDVLVLSLPMYATCQTGDVPAACAANQSEDIVPLGLPMALSSWERGLFEVALQSVSFDAHGLIRDVERVDAELLGAQPGARVFAGLGIDAAGTFGFSLFEVGTDGVEVLATHSIAPGDLDWAKLYVAEPLVLVPSSNGVEVFTLGNRYAEP